MGLTSREIAAIDTGTRGFRDRFIQERYDFQIAESKLLEYNFFLLPIMCSRMFVPFSIWTLLSLSYSILVTSNFL